MGSMRSLSFQLVHNSLQAKKKSGDENSSMMAHEGLCKNMKIYLEGRMWFTEVK